MTTVPLSHNGYTVGWVCALQKEQTAATAMLDDRHPDLPKPPIDQNAYTLGSIGDHNVVIACLPQGRIGTTPAATVANQMINTFPSIKFGLLVGIGGGIPPEVRLGDVVVSVPVNGYPGVVQWDFGKEEHGKFKRTGALNNPPMLLLTALSKMGTAHEMEDPKISAYLEEMGRKWPKLSPKYLRSDKLQDVLFRADYGHISRGYKRKATALGDGDYNIDMEETCQHCDITKIMKQKSRDMKIHKGLIASGNRVIKDATFRDKIGEDLLSPVLCVEMEAAGLMNDFPCLVIRGISDYADSHKNKAWQEHAAATAAAFAKELLSYVQATQVSQERPAKDVIISQFHELKGEVQEIKSRQINQRDLEILNWLTPVDYGTQQSDYLRRWQQGTCQWFLNRKEYQQWVDNKDQTLFCPGMPGAGKTILTSVVVDDLEHKFHGDISVGIAYIYCNFNRKDEQKVQDLISSLLKQLLSYQCSLPQDLRDLYGYHHPKRTQPPLGKISEILQSVIASFSRVFIVVDALDECQISGSCRDQFLSGIFSIQTQLHANIFVTSRRIPDITETFRDSLVIEISAKPDDIGEYLRGHMSQLRNFVVEDPEMQNGIISSIMKAAHGMFLLVYLHFDSLLGIDTPAAIWNSLPNKTTESNYDAIYNGIMERIETQRSYMRERAKQVLSWISFAKRPLHKQELQHAMAIEVRKSELDEQNIPHIKDIISVCAGLVTIDEKSGIIRLVHYTTHVYFNRTCDRWFPKVEMNIALACSTYLSFSAFARGQCETDEELTGRLKLYPLYDYAARNWGYHARASSIYRDFLPFLYSHTHVEASVQIFMPSHEHRHYRCKMTALHLAAHFGLHEIVTALLKEDCASTAYHNGRISVPVTTVNGGVADVDVLLDIPRIDPNTDDYWWRTPLLTAVMNKHIEIVRCLLANPKVDPNIANWQGDTPLHVAIKHRCETMVGLLLAHKALDPNLLTNRRGDISLSLELGRLCVRPDTSQHRHDAQIHPAIKYNQGKAPLSYAAEHGREAIVKLLLSDKRVNPNSEDNCGCTPISHAADSGHETIVKLLLCDERVGPDWADQFGRTPLWYAIKGGHEGTVKLLLLSGKVNPYSRDYRGLTPLYQAKIEGNEAILNLLYTTNPSCKEWLKSWN